MIQLHIAYVVAYLCCNPRPSNQVKTQQVKLIMKRIIFFSLEKGMPPNRAPNAKKNFLNVTGLLKKCIVSVISLYFSCTTQPLAHPITLASKLFFRHLVFPTLPMTQAIPNS